MKKIFSILALLVLAASCSKEHQPAPVQPPAGNKKLVRFNIEENPLQSQAFTYDAAGRIIGVDDSLNSSMVTFNGNTVIYTRISKATKTINAYGTIKVNSNGYASQFDLNILGAGGNWIHSIRDYTYDANGYMTSESVDNVGSPYDDSETLEYTNGNLTKETFYYAGAISSTWVYTYSDLPDKTGLGGNFIITSNFLSGKGNRNLVVKMEQFNSSGVKTYESQIENELDADNYIIRKTVTRPGTGTVTHVNFTYEK